MSLSDVRHQQAAQRRLQRALTAARTPHAWIFHGPEGVGKEMLATELTRILLCKSPVEVPCSREEGSSSDVDSGSHRQACGQCSDCILMTAGTHPDLHFIYRELIKYHPNAEFRKRQAIDLGVNVIREFLIAPAGRRPSQAKAKVFIIRQAERMKDPAQNALLKLLEEPPENTYLILLSTSIDRLLPTTRSRCQTVPFGPLPTAFVQEKLLRVHADLHAADAQFLAATSEGRLGPALESAAVEYHMVKKPIIEELAVLQSGRVSAWASTVEEAGKTLADNLCEFHPDASESDLRRSAMRLLLSAISYAFADVIRDSGGETRSAVPAHRDQQDAIGKISSRMDVVRAAEAIGQVAAAEARLGANVNVTLILEGLAFDLVRCLSQSRDAAPSV